MNLYKVVFYPGSDEEAKFMVYAKNQISAIQEASELIQIHHGEEFCIEVGAIRDDGKPRIIIRKDYDPIQVTVKQWRAILGCVSGGPIVFEFDIEKDAWATDEVLEK